MFMGISEGAPRSQAPLGNADTGAPLHSGAVTPHKLRDRDQFHGQHEKGHGFRHPNSKAELRGLHSLLEIRKHKKDDAGRALVNISLKGASSTSQE